MRGALLLCVAACATAGVPPPRDADSAQLQTQCDQGEADACTRLADEIVQRRPGAPAADRALALRLYARACDELGGARACLRLAYAYGAGRVPEAGRDLGRAAMYAERGCDLGSTDACGLFGSMLVVGEGVIVDRERGRTLLEDACEKGHLQFCYELYGLLRGGRLEARGTRDASHYLDKFCARGFGDLCAACANSERTDAFAPKNASVPLKLLREMLLTGTIEIHMPVPVLEHALSQGVRQISAMTLVCFSVTGDISCARFLKKTGYELADQTLLSGISQWRFSPYLVDDKPVPVCTAYLFNNLID